MDIRKYLEVCSIFRGSIYVYISLYSSAFFPFSIHYFFCSFPGILERFASAIHTLTPTYYLHIYPPFTVLCCREVTSESTEGIRSLLRGGGDDPTKSHVSTKASRLAVSPSHPFIYFPQDQHR